MSTPPHSLYVHVPFCARKCEYCAFYSHSVEGGLIDRYVRALTRELELRRPDLSVPLRTVFFGGGTPSLLNLRQWQEIGGAFVRLGLGGAAEWTVECNPATISRDKARLLLDYGVNRISMGVQSLNDALLDRLGRVHTRAMVHRSYNEIRQAGFKNINLDLMFAIPGQSMEIWRETLDEIIALGCEHLSCYEVIYEEDTPLYAQLKAGSFSVDDDLAADMFDHWVNALGVAGYRQYEIANSARDDLGGGHAELPRFACQHNVNYWRGGAHLVVGPSATGFENGVRYRNVSDTVRYCEALERGRLPREWQEELPPFERAGEIAAFGLRMNAGWTWDAFRSATGYDLRDAWGEDMESLADRGWAFIEGDRFRLSPKGLRFADAAGSEFLRPSTKAPLQGGRGTAERRAVPTGRD